MFGTMCERDVHGESVKEMCMEKESKSLVFMVVLRQIYTYSLKQCIENNERQKRNSTLPVSSVNIK